MRFIKTIGKDGKPYFFKYELENQYCSTRKIWKVCFKTTYINQKDNNWFDFKVAAKGDSFMEVTDMFDTMDHSTHQLLFKGKGLPEALILEAQKVFPNKVIISATGDGRWPPGTAVWQRLVRNELAFYDSEHDIFILNKLILT